MAYVRFSSVIGTDVTIEKMIEEMQAGHLKSKDLTKRQLETPGSYQSVWYIFWYNTEYVSSYPENMEDQFLAVYMAGASTRAMLPYDEVKEMYTTDDWSALGYGEVRQKDVLRTCVKQWLDDVEDRKRQFGT